MMPLALVSGLVALFGGNGVTWNDQPVTGISGFFIAFIIVFLSGLLSGAILFLWLNFGLWMYRQTLPKDPFRLTLENTETTSA